MRARSAAFVAWSLLGVGLLVSLAAFLLVLTSPEPGGETVSPLAGFVDEPFVAGSALISLTYSFVGALIVSRRPGNGLGWLFVVDGVVLAALSFASVYQVVALEADPGSLPGGSFAAWASDISYLPVVGMLTVFLFLLFPDGRLDTRALRVTALAAAVGSVSGAAATTIEQHLYSYPEIENPAGIAGPEWLFALLGALGALLLAGSLITSIVLLVGRLRRARGRERDQLRLLVWAAVVSTALVVPGFVSESPGTLRLVASGVGALLLPVSVGVAILRHRLLDIDLVIGRTVVIALLGAFITAVYVAVVVGVGALVGHRGDPVLSAVAAAVVALAFQPVHRWARRLGNRVVYGERATPYEVLSALANRMADTYAADDLLPRIARTVAEGTGAHETAVWLRIGDELRATAVWPPKPRRERSVRLAGDALPTLPGQLAVAVQHQGDLLGALSVEKPPGEPISPTEERLLMDVASQSGLALRNVRLTEELRDTIEELRTSRQRLVRAQDEERRKLERNIHDGAQQQLVALAVKVRMADTLMERDAEQAHRVLTEARSDAAAALDDLRDLARGIFPPLLADQGLAAALGAQARRAAVPVEVRADGVGRFAQEVEATTYFCCLEAVQNAAKYASASSVEIRLSATDGTLAFTVSDDGGGFDPSTTRPGSGLQNMADRLAAIGGSLEIRSEPGRGTTVSGRIPVAPAERQRL
jgi:signal transduction histidine kinase